MKSHRRRFGGALAAYLLGIALAHAQGPPSANALLNQAKTQAAVNQRAIFAIFHASW
jgi:hypothetical protein